MRIHGNFRRILLFLGIFTCLVIIYLIYSTTKDRFRILRRDDETHAVEPKPHFVHINQLRDLAELEPKNSRRYIDYFLNIRKLTLFAVHELNKIVSDSPTNNCSIAGNCPKWWANPLKTTDLSTRCFEDSVPVYCEHEITFMAEPGPVRFSTVIGQNRMTHDAEKYDELKIMADFKRLADAHETQTGILPLDALPPVLDEEKLKTYNLKDNEIDPELYSWKRHVSFLVGDYVDFRADKESLYPISPGKSEAEQKYCGDALKMIIMVSSAPPHFENRRVIRETYGSDENLLSKQVRLVFLFGRVTNQTLQTMLEKEAEEHDDLIQGDFMDSYHNLSLSHLLMYNWVQRTCETVGLPRYILKADDDFFLNIELALRVAYSNPQYELIGTLYCGTPPIRSVAYMTKYYTPRYMYMPDLYVGYLSGVAYLIRTDIIPRMLKISLTTPMIHMDDEYITGLLPRQLDFTPVGSSVFTYVRTEPNPCATKKVACSAAVDVADIRVQYNEWIKPIPANCSLDNIPDLLKINPLRPQDKTGCIFE